MIVFKILSTRAIRKVSWIRQLGLQHLISRAGTSFTDCQRRQGFSTRVRMASPAEITQARAELDLVPDCQIDGPGVTFK